jgi:hypothetical protein
MVKNDSFETVDIDRRCLLTATATGIVVAGTASLPGTSSAFAAKRTAQATNLFLLEDVEDLSKTRNLAESDLSALRAVGDWIKTFVARPHKDLGRAGPVCPFVPVFGLLLSGAQAGARQMSSSS